MLESTIIVNYIEIDENHFGVKIIIDNKNANTQFGLCEFLNEMEYLGIPSSTINRNNDLIFVFDNGTDLIILEREIKRFAKQYSIG